MIRTKGSNLVGNKGLKQFNGLPQTPYVQVHPGRVVARAEHVRVVRAEGPGPLGKKNPEYADDFLRHSRLPM